MITIQPPPNLLLHLSPVTVTVSLTLARTNASQNRKQPPTAGPHQSLPHQSRILQNRGHLHHLLGTQPRPIITAKAPAPGPAANIHSKIVIDPCSDVRHARQVRDGSGASEDARRAAAVADEMGGRHRGQRHAGLGGVAAAPGEDRGGGGREGEGVVVAAADAGDGGWGKGEHFGGFGDDESGGVGVGVGVGLFIFFAFFLLSFRSL